MLFVPPPSTILQLLFVHTLSPLPRPFHHPELAGSWAVVIQTNMKMLPVILLWMQGEDQARDTLWIALAMLSPGPLLRYSYS